MEKRSYVKPVLSGEEFIPQNYIAACGDSGAVYKFKCDAPSGTLYYKNSNGNYERLGSFNPCPVTHETDVDGYYADGYVDLNRNGRYDSGEEVKVYIEYDYWGRIDNAHATQNVNMETWEVAKS